jgi:hypothetical protein
MLKCQILHSRQTDIYAQLTPHMRVVVTACLTRNIGLELTRSGVSECHITQLYNRDIESISYSKTFLRHESTGHKQEQLNIRASVMHNNSWINFYSWAWVAQLLQCLTTDWTTEVRSPTETKDFSFSLCVHTSSQAQPDSYPMSTGDPFPGVNSGRGVTLTAHHI